MVWRAESGPRGLSKRVNIDETHTWLPRIGFMMFQLYFRGDDQELGGKVVVTLGQS